MSKEIGDLLELVTAGEWGNNQGTPGGIDTGVIRSANFTKDHQFNAKEIVVRSIEEHKRQKKLLRKGDILIEKSGGSPDQPVGRVLFYDLKGEHTCSNFISILRPSKHVEAKFLYYSLCNLYEKGVVRNYQQQTTGIINLQLGEYLRESIYLPPLPEQKKIAEILSGIDKEICVLAKKKEKLEKALTSYLGIAISSEGESVEMQELCKVTDGAHKTPTYTTSGVPFLRVTDVKAGNLDPSSFKYISTEEHLELIKRCKPEKGDVLLSKNGTIGISRLIDWDWDFSIFVSLALLKIKDKKRLSPEFCEILLKSPLLASQIFATSKQGAVTNLHLEEIRKFRVYLPSPEKQLEIVFQYKSLCKLISICSLLIEKMNFLKQGVSWDLLSGRKRVSI
jgi:type I restriction enzyme S subunit